MLGLRKILFYLFVFIYIIFCPFIILRALGILYKPSKTENLVQTGLIYIATVPAGASVTINGIPFPEQTPTVLRNLTPGAYNLRISLPNYRPVDRTANVLPSQATRFDPILMVPNEWHNDILSHAHYRSLWPLNDNPALIVSKGSQLGDMFIYRWQKSIEESISAIINSEENKNLLLPLFSKSFFYLKSELSMIHSVHESPYLLLRVKSPPEERYLWLDPRTTPPTVKDLSDLFTGDPEALIWDTSNNPSLYTLQNGSVNHLNLNPRAIFPKIIEGIRSFSLFEKKIYALTKTNHLLMLNADGTNKEDIALPPRLTSLLGQMRVLPTFSLYSTRDIFFMTENGALLSNRYPCLIIDHDCQGILFSPETKRLLVWTKNRIGTIDLLHDDANKESNHLSVEWLYDKGKRIEQLFVVNRGSHALFLDQGKVSLLEIGVKDNPLSQEILRVRKNSQIYYSDSIGRLFYLGEAGEHLASITLLPQRKPPPKQKAGAMSKAKE